MYYPISKITPNLYTSGNEFTDESTGRSYRGYYFKTFDGKFFTGKIPGGGAKELISNTKPLAQISQNPNFHLPRLTQEDYNLGSIRRYFIKRVNSGVDTIREISVEDYNKLQNNVLYIRTFLDWKISGVLYDDNTGVIPVPGIIDTNKKTIKIKEKELPGLAQYLVNLAEFSKEIL